MNGFKPSQRRVLYCWLKCNCKVEIKVVQLAGCVCERSWYHYSETNLHETIIKIAQGFSGCDHANPSSLNGQGVTRIVTRKDAHSPR
ncbi:unnamed protein product [Albugo candida]|uniref:DNA topoisomerase (ATP-hydrolyzing) n=1 Tax=Albugo candida TaxID=65357 RepID=A0A024FXY2_9STRA|nr:unnamed protein product [Albugo candida]|eukprot:CCI11494.1 unnamed protein product [Albugo candida]